MCVGLMNDLLLLDTLSHNYKKNSLPEISTNLAEFFVFINGVDPNLRFVAQGF